VLAEKEHAGGRRQLDDFVVIWAEALFPESKTR
jgi:hypothetical protein